MKLLEFQLLEFQRYYNGFRADKRTNARSGRWSRAAPARASVDIAGRRIVAGVITPIAA
jgi:hypothetical protein